MEYVKLGKTNLNVSKICLGGMSYGDPNSGHHPWALNEQASRPFIKKALELGINFFDTANMYSYGAGEEVLGRALQDYAERDKIIIATKVFFPMIKGDPKSGGLSRKAILHEIDASLKRLGTDYVDLYQIHRWDYLVPIEETLEALNDIVKAGKARYIGASSMFAWQFAKAIYTSRLHGWAEFISMQPHYNLLYREEEREMLPFCQSEGIAVLPWSPLARGRLARPLKSETTTRLQTDQFGSKLYQATEHIDQKIIEQVMMLAQKRNLPQSQIALAWMIQNPLITAPIIGATKAHHLEDAVLSLSVKLSDEEIKILEEHYAPHAIAGFE